MTDHTKRHDRGPFEVIRDAGDYEGRHRFENTLGCRWMGCPLCVEEMSSK